MAQHGVILVALALLFVQLAAACTIDPPRKPIDHVDYTRLDTRSANAQTFTVGDFRCTINDPEPANVAGYIQAIGGAMQILSDVLDMNGELIDISTDVLTLDPGQLGGAGPNNFFGDYMFGGHFFPASMETVLENPNTISPDISMQLADNINWYFGTDGNTPAGELPRHRGTARALPRTWVRISPSHLPLCSLSLPPPPLSLALSPAAL